MSRFTPRLSRSVVVHRRSVRLPAAGRVPLLLAGVGVVAALAPAAGTVAFGSPPPSAVSATVDASSATASVRWQTPPRTTGPIRYYTIKATDRATGYFGVEHACGACSSVTWPALTLGHSYRFAVTATTVSGRTSRMAKTGYVLVPEGACARSRSVCVAVAGAKPTATRARIPLGVLDTATTARTDRSYLTLLGVTGWRLDADMPDAPSIFRAMPAGTTSTEILYDKWRSVQGDDPTARCALARTSANPWDDWNAYDSWVRSFVRAQTAAHQAPTYWDLMNEPSAASFTRSACTKAPTTALVEQVLAHSYRDVKAVTPTAKVMAPSLSYLDDSDLLESGTGGALIPLNGLLYYSDAQGIRWDAVDYHELSSDASDAYPATPQSVATHLVSVRQLMSSHPSSRHAKIFVNEFNGTGSLAGSRPGTNELNLLPGRAVGYVAALAGGGADGAGLSCWNDRTTAGPSDCYNGSLDGLLDPQTGQRRSVWFALQRASCMAGDIAPFASTSATVNGYAAVSGSTLRVLLGRFDRRVSGPTVPVDLRLGVPVPAARTTAVTIQAIPDSRFSGTSLPPAQTRTLPVTAGIVHVALPAFADDGAYSVIVHPVGSALSACDTVR